MNKTAIKNYAVWARVALIEAVKQRSYQYGITEKDSGDPKADSVNGFVLTPGEKQQRQALIGKIREKGYEQVCEEAAYTWFNRFAALRFMEVNGYLPSRVRVFTDEQNAFKPQILAEAMHLELDGLDLDRVIALTEKNRTDELYKYLLITQCNALNAVLPGMFQKIHDYTELLFPDNLLREGSVIERMIAMIPEEDWTDQVQSIGWLYQYYNTEPKDKVFADLKKNIKISKEKIPAATQLFTPDWIVRYMVENSLGRLWVEGHPNDEMKASWKYYLEETEQEPEVQAQLAEIRKGYAELKPTDIKVIDPCCGSGHILCYLFDVLMQIYEASGYTARDAAQSILIHNLWGLDIDERAAQLSYFAVMMKARQYDRRFFSRNIQPHVYAITESNSVSREAVEYFCKGDAALTRAMQMIQTELHDAKEYGSILTCSKQDWDAFNARFNEVYDDIALHRDEALALLPLVQTGEALSQQYDVVVTNPPYMGGSGMSGKLSEFVKKNYPDSKSDLFAVFIERCGKMTGKNGYQAMITQHAWMFLSSYEKLRTKLQAVDNVNMAHLGARAFEEIGGEVVQTTSFVLRRSNTKGYAGTYCRLIEPTTQQGKEDMFLSCKNRFIAQQDKFSNIPGAPVAYWVSDAVFLSFSNAETFVKQYALGEGKNVTTDNAKYIHWVWEVSSPTVGSNNEKWRPCVLGGDFRKWFGNVSYVIDWSEKARKFYRESPSGRIIREEFWNMCGVTWGKITSGLPNFRLLEAETMYQETAILQKDIKDSLLILALLNSKLAAMFLALLNPTVNIQQADVSAIPIPSIPEEVKANIRSLAQDNVSMSQGDWDSFETSWNFKRHPLLPFFADDPDESTRIEMWYRMWEAQCQNRFDQLKANEEKLNRIFIDIYGLQDELTPEVEDKDVTVRKADLTREIKSLISYAVGCMFGRYSLDEPGLIFAGYDRVEYSEGYRDGNDPELVKYGIDQPGSLYSYITDKRWVNQEKYQSFNIDVDNIIPICDDEYFEDDIVERFIRFIQTVYGKDTLEENLKFIADALGGKGTPRDVIRSYFLNDFYADHLKIYQKRPIYWLFDSGKKNGFKCLIYMHRYQPDTLARIRTDYVHELQSRYQTAIQDLNSRVESAAPAERVKLNKQLQKIQTQEDELRAYEEKIHHLADQMVAIDLDDGVKVNYAKFEDVLAKIK